MSLRPTLDQVRNLGDFATTVNWYVQIVHAPKSLAGGTIDMSDFNIRCETVSTPKRQGSVESVQIRGMPPVHQMGLVLPDTSWTMTVVETVDNKSTKILKELQEIHYKQGIGSALTKKDTEARIRVVRMDRQDKPIWQYELIGCYLESYDPGGELSSDSASIMKPSLTWVFDDFIEGPAGNL